MYEKFSLVAASNIPSPQVEPIQTGQNRTSEFDQSVSDEPRHSIPPSDHCVLSRFKCWVTSLLCCSSCAEGDEEYCKAPFSKGKTFRKDWMGSVPVAMETFDNSFLRCYYPVYSAIDCHSDESPPPPPYEDHLFTNFCDESKGASLETAGTNQDLGDGNGTPWCKILYWEGRDRKGKEFAVTPPSINVLGETPHGTGLSLPALFGGISPDERVMKTRRKICQGLVLWREGEVVWVYNRSEAPVYLNSASLDGSFYHLNLYKCPPGYAMIIYYYEMARRLMGLPGYKTTSDKADVNSVRISFAKGWGKNYHRREILCCPCWIEVHVVPTLKVEQLRPPR